LGFWQTPQNGGEQPRLSRRLHAQRCVTRAIATVATSTSPSRRLAQSTGDSVRYRHPPSHRITVDPSSRRSTQVDAQGAGRPRYGSRRVRRRGSSPAAPDRRVSAARPLADLRESRVSARIVPALTADRPLIEVTNSVSSSASTTLLGRVSVSASRPWVALLDEFGRGDDLELLVSATGVADRSLLRPATNVSSLPSAGCSGRPDSIRFGETVSCLLPSVDRRCTSRSVDAPSLSCRTSRNGPKDCRPLGIHCSE
jgi:hypothetical protein